MKTKKELTEKENNLIPAFFTLAGLVLIIAIIFQQPMSIQPGNKTPFEQGFDKVLSLDKKYGGDYRNERLNHTMVNISVIPMMINDLETMKQDLAGKDDNGSIALSRFIDVRIAMLNTQRLYQQAALIGPIGTAFDGFRCSEAPYLIKVIDLYNETRQQFLDTMLGDLDALFYDYPEYRSVIGFEGNKTKFYGSNIRALNQIAEENDFVLKRYCQVG